MGKAKTSKRDLGVWLWLATDGEVRAQTHIPTGGFDHWLGFCGNPPFTQEEAERVVMARCDLAPESRIADNGKLVGRYFFRSDPRTQGDLRKQFEAAVLAEGAKRGRTG